MKKLLACLLTLMLLTSASALADVTVEKSITLDRYISLCKATNCYTYRTEEGYQLFDANGTALTKGYDGINIRCNGLYLEVGSSAAELPNNTGLLDGSGQELLPMAYGDFDYFGNDWVLAYVLAPSDTDLGEYKDSAGNKYIVTRTDVLYQGKLIGSLGREDYVKSYMVTNRGAYLGIKQSSTQMLWLDGQFNRTNVTAKDYVSSSEFDGYKSIIHSPTQQQAFVAECTLTADQVEQPTWYDSNTGTLLDLQGNVLAKDLPYDYVYFRSNAFETRQKQLRGIMGLDGTEILPPKYSEIASSDEGFFASGYNALIDADGHLLYVDQSGQVTASVDYQLSSSDYKGFSQNNPMVAVNNMGKYIIITATHGELPEKYDDVHAYSNGVRMMSVQKDGSWGCIDMAGNVVIPFEHRSALTFSFDGTMAEGYTNDREQRIYFLKETEAAPQPEAADGSWTCDCGSVNTSNFCPSCGSAKPVAEPQCSSCGYKPQGDTPKFCPECGTKF